MCDISSLRVNGPSEPGRLRDVCVCQWVKVCVSVPRHQRCLKHFILFEDYVVPLHSASHCFAAIISSSIFSISQLNLVF